MAAIRTVVRKFTKPFLSTYVVRNPDTRTVSKTVTCPVEIPGWFKQHTYRLSYTSLENSEAMKLMIGNPDLGGIVHHLKEKGCQVYSQQVYLGGSPTILSLIGKPKSEANVPAHYDFDRAVQTIVSDGIWLRARTTNMVIDIRDLSDPKVYVDRPRRYSRRIKQHELPQGADPGSYIYQDTRLERLLRDHLDIRLMHHHSSYQFAERAKQANIRNLCKKPFFKENIRASAEVILNASVKQGNGPSAILVVQGDMHPSEAKSLVNELTGASKKHFSFSGDVIIDYDREKGVAVYSSRHEEEAKKKLQAFLAGFNKRFVISDLHLSSGGAEDNFGPEKMADLIKFLDRVIASRGMLILNGDFLDLWQAKFGKIEEQYKPLFDKMKQVRKILYIAGNHDEMVLEDVLETARSRDLETARKNSLRGGISFMPGGKEQQEGFVAEEGSSFEYKRLLRLLDNGCVRGSRARLLEKARSVYESKDNIEQTRMRLVLTKGLQQLAVHGFESRDIYIDSSILDTKDYDESARTLYEVIFDSMENLNNILTEEFKNMSIVPHHVDPNRHVFIEHSHKADVFNYQNPVGMFIAGTGVYLERAAMFLLGRNNVPALFERAVNSLQVFAPQRNWRSLPYLDRVTGITKMMQQLAGITEVTYIGSHTHIPSSPDSAGNFIDGFLSCFTNAHYYNTGTWSGSPEDLSRKHPSDWLKGMRGIRRLDRKAPDIYGLNKKENVLVISGFGPDLDIHLYDTPDQIS